MVQEIDIATGKVLFEWDSLDHIPVTDTYTPFAGGTKAAPFDYLHINSIAIAPDGDLLLSARDTSDDLQGVPAEREGRLAARREAVQLPDGAGRHLLVPAPHHAAWTRTR